MNYQYQVETSTSSETLSFEQLKEKHVITGWNENPRQREDLQDQPKLQGLLGPMYGGKKNGSILIRYESAAEYLTYD